MGVASPDEEGAEEGEELEDIEMDPLVYDRAEFNSGEVKVQLVGGVCPHFRICALPDKSVLIRGCGLNFRGGVVLIWAVIGGAWPHFGVGGSKFGPYPLDQAVS